MPRGVYDRSKKKPQRGGGESDEAFKVRMDNWIHELGYFTQEDLKKAVEAISMEMLKSKEEPIVNKTNNTLVNEAEHVADTILEAGNYSEEELKQFWDLVRAIVNFKLKKKVNGTGITAPEA